MELTSGMNMFITAQGFAKTGMLSVLIGAVCNIVPDPVFISNAYGRTRSSACNGYFQACSTICAGAFLAGKRLV